MADRHTPEGSSRLTVIDFKTEISFQNFILHNTHDDLEDRYCIVEIYDK